MTREEAIKVVKNNWPDSSYTRLREALETLVPELKESEDEMVRKSIIGFLTIISSLKDGMTVSNEDFDSKALLEWVAWLKKQDAQTIKEALRTEYEKGKADAIAEMQNPVWSEDDEKGLGDALWCCKQAASIAKDENDMGNAWFAEKWLNSLKPLQKLSEKAEIEAGKFYMCLEDIEGYDSFTKGKVYHSLYDDTLINDNHIEVKVEPSYDFRIATDAEVVKAKRMED